MTCTSLDGTRKNLTGMSLAFYSLLATFNQQRTILTGFLSFQDSMRSTNFSLSSQIATSSTRPSRKIGSFLLRTLQQGQGMLNFSPSPISPVVNTDVKTHIIVESGCKTFPASSAKNLPRPRPDTTTASTSHRPSSRHSQLSQPSISPCKTF